MRLNLLSITGAFALLVLFIEDLLLVPFEADRTGMVYAIAAGLCIGVVCAYRKRWEAVRRVAELLTAMGLLGTVLGFWLVLQTYTPGDGIPPGLYTALSTTLVGIVGFIWLQICRWVCRE